jgi:hypothetical protein
MLSLTDQRWRTLKGGYRTTYDASVALRRLEEGHDAWDELWNELHHQGDVGEASYASVPHLVRISQAAPRRDWNLYALAGLIEIERHRKSNPPIPDWLGADYSAAWRELEKLALYDLSNASDQELIRTALAVIAISRGQLRLGAFLTRLDESELAELTEEKLAWSKLYV